MAFPLDIRDIMSSGAKIQAEREKLIRIAVLVDAEAPDVAVEALREALRPQTGTARLHVEAAVPGDIMVVDGAVDALIALTGPTDTVAATLADARERFIPAVALALAEDREEVSRRLQHPVLDVIVAEEVEDLLMELGRWLIERVQGKRLALASNFDFMRRSMAEEAIKNTAFQNALIGGVVFIPGADMPLMTANQAKMLMQIAAAYGQPLGMERIKELAAVVGGGFAMRTVARQFVGLVPGFGWAVKAGIGYSGTLAMGYAALEYFESGGDVRGLAAKVAEARDRAIESARKMRGRSGRREIIEAQATVVEPQAGVPAEVVESPLSVPANQPLPAADPAFELPSDATRAGTEQE